MHELAEWEGHGHDEAVDTASLQHGALIVPQQATLSLSLVTRHDKVYFRCRTCQHNKRLVDMSNLHSDCTGGNSLQ